MDEKNNKYLPLNLQAVFMVLAIFIITSAAMANTIIQKQDFNGISNFSKLLTFDRLNTSDTLTSIKISLNLQIKGGTLIIDNDGDSNVSGIFEFGIFGNTNSTEVNLPLSLLSTKLCYSRAFYLDSNTGDGKGDYDPSPPDGMQFTGSGNSGDMPAFVENTFWNDYIGTGTYNIAVSIISLVDYGNFDNVEYSIATPIQTTGYVEVIYTSIPEPASIILLVLGSYAFLKKSV